MQASISTQRKLVELAGLDARLAGLRHRDKNLPEQDALDELRGAERTAREGAARARIRLEDVSRDHAKAVGEHDFLSTRATRTQRDLADPTTTPQQKRELRHEEAAVARLLDDAAHQLAELTTRRDATQADLDHEGARLDALAGQIAAAEADRLTALGDLEATVASLTRDRERILREVPTELLDVYDEVRRDRGAGAGELQGQRCGACQMELDRTTMASFSREPLDAVLRCPECRAILVRPEGTEPGAR